MGELRGLDLLRAVRKQITEHPETHDQRHWARRIECGTTHCIAGWACVLNGHTLQWCQPNIGVQEAWAVGPVGVSIEGVALELLGLDQDEADDLFHDHSNRVALEKLDEIIADREAEAQQRV